ncbi:patatin-like phospholipase domain-containing protein [Sphingobacterium paludis]|uniref:Patatin-like phospholipase n=1 Tax=Sphingobacterium paludis TaxID=1476465 RepID=A0A4R7CRI7_9SPHI|nr:patatin-like phospholipase family protein [Sphingobacterium paludis]TDS09743.1 patatin-like phospholipase [Sphingobacterium paludis]
MEEKQKFKICLTMAGAVSAGAFTAGVMDYLLETLDLWEKAKQKNIARGVTHADYDHSIPMHEVEIDVISGASAGGITGALTMLNLVDKDYRPVNKDNPQGKMNRFYQSWVEMADDDQSDTFEKMLAKDDLKKLKKGEKPEALLNADPIDAIANNMLQLNQLQEYPSYISPDLDLVLTTTNLRGINFQLDFGGYGKTGPMITSHAGFFRYKLAHKDLPEGIPPGNELYYVLNLRNPRDMNYLKEATLSTAAFPIGLKSREVAISQEFISRYPNYLFGQQKGIRPLIKESSVYKFNSIDGGLINNEPFAVGLKVLREKNPANLSDRYAVVMIDPFPNSDHDVEDENPRPDIITVAKGMFKALRNQAMFNQDGILDAIEGRDHTKFLIQPVRKLKVGKVMTPVKKQLASAPFSGFGGFMDKSFRLHDYHLGRLNCQAFLRYYFALPEGEVASRLGREPHDLAKVRFAFNEKQFDVQSRNLFPIIPDLRVIKARTNEMDHEKFGADAQLDFMDFPVIAEADFNKRYKQKIKQRLEAVLNATIGNFWFKALNRLFIRKSVSNIIIDAILKDFRESGQIR